MDVDMRVSEVMGTRGAVAVAILAHADPWARASFSGASVARARGG